MPAGSPTVMPTCHTFTPPPGAAARRASQPHVDEGLLAQIVDPGGHLATHLLLVQLVAEGLEGVALAAAGARRPPVGHLDDVKAELGAYHGGDAPHRQG